MSQQDANRNLLWGSIALGQQFITGEDLVLAVEAWVLDKSRPLRTILCEHGLLVPNQGDRLDARVEAYVASHGGDPAAALRAVFLPEPVRNQLQRVTDPQLTQGLDHVGVGEHGEHEYRGRFCILDRLGGGGQGRLSVAEDMELARRVALKEILPAHGEGPDRLERRRQRFELEARVTGRLEHPGVVPVYGLGIDNAGQPFYAMRWVRGESLKDAIRAFHTEPAPRRLDYWGVGFRRLLNRLVAVCNAVAYANSRGVIHRDIKPDNVMLGPFGETYVMDWGVARLLNQSSRELGFNDETIRLTLGDRLAADEENHVVGTFAYMSPEQADGRTQDVGTAADVFSLGATLYALLTGRPPYVGDRDAQWRRAIHCQFPDPRVLRTAVPPPLAAICMKAMALDPRATPRRSRWRTIWSAGWRTNRCRFTATPRCTG
jgi:serine/threonine protein kinase